jgi:hypothetical protein
MDSRSWWGSLDPRYILLMGGGLAIIALGITLRIAGDLGWGLYAIAAVVISGLGLLGVAIGYPTSGTDPHPSYSEGYMPSASDLTDPPVDGVGNPSLGPTRNPRPSQGLYDEEALPPWNTSASGRSAPAEILGETWTPTSGGPLPEVVNPVSGIVNAPPRLGESKKDDARARLLLDPSVSADAEERTSARASAVTLLPSPSRPSTGHRGPEVEASPNPSEPPIATGPVVRTISITASTGATLVREALNPTPPHLRAGSEPVAPRVAQPASKFGLPNRSTRCANCRTAIRVPKIWRRCPDCHHQLCNHCIVEALLAYEGSWCAHCAGLRHLDALAKELLPPQSNARDTNRSPVVGVTELHLQEFDTLSGRGP